MLKPDLAPACLIVPIANKSQHPFDRWHIQQIVDQTGLDLTAPPPPPNELLWSWDAVGVGAGATWSKSGRFGQSKLGA
jgi:hypothetical protein